MKPLGPLTVMIATLAVPSLAAPPAQAKVMPVAATACGADGCTRMRVGNRPYAFDLMIPAIDRARTGSRPHRIGRWHSVDLTFGPPAVRAEARAFGKRFPVGFLGRTGLLRTRVGKPGGRWVSLTEGEAHAYEEVTAGVDALPARQLADPGDGGGAGPKADAGDDGGAAPGVDGHDNGGEAPRADASERRTSVAQEPTASSPDGSSTRSAWIAIGGGVLIVVGGGVAWRLHRPRRRPTPSL